MQSWWEWLLPPSKYNLSHSMIAHVCIMIYYLTRIPSTYHQNLYRIPTIPDRSRAYHLIFFGKPIVRKMLFFKCVCSGRCLTSNIKCVSLLWLLVDRRRYQFAMSVPIRRVWFNSPCLIKFAMSGSILYVWFNSLCPVKFATSGLIRYVWLNSPCLIQFAMSDSIRHVWFN